jgi:hypothetical protein
MSKDFPKHYWSTQRLGEEFHATRDTLSKKDKQFVSETMGETFSHRYSTEVLGYIPLLHPDSKGIRQGNDEVYFDPNKNEIVVVEAKGQNSPLSEAQKMHDYPKLVSEKIEDRTGIYKRASPEEQEIARMVLRAAPEKGIGVRYEAHRTRLEADGGLYTQIEKQEKVFANWSDVESVLKRISGESEAVPGTLETRLADWIEFPNDDDKTHAKDFKPEEAREKTEEILKDPKNVEALDGKTSLESEGKDIAGEPDQRVEKLRDGIEQEKEIRAAGDEIEKQQDHEREKLQNEADSTTTDHDKSENEQDAFESKNKLDLDEDLIHSHDHSVSTELYPAKPVTTDLPDESESIKSVEGIPVDDLEPAEPAAEDGHETVQDIVDVEVFPLDVELEPAEPAITEDRLDNSNSIIEVTPNDNLLPVEPISPSEGSKQLEFVTSDALLEVTTTAAESLSEPSPASGTAVEQPNSSVETTGGFGEVFGEQGWRNSGGSHW